MGLGEEYWEVENQNNSTEDFPMLQNSKNNKRVPTSSTAAPSPRRA